MSMTVLITLCMTNEAFAQKKDRPFLRALGQAVKQAAGTVGSAVLYDAAVKSGMSEDEAREGVKAVTWALGGDESKAEERIGWVDGSKNGYDMRDEITTETMKLVGTAIGKEEEMDVIIQAKEAQSEYRSAEYNYRNGDESVDLEKAREIRDQKIVDVAVDAYIDYQEKKEQQRREELYSNEQTSDYEDYEDYEAYDDDYLDDMLEDDAEVEAVEATEMIENEYEVETVGELETLSDDIEIKDIVEHGYIDLGLSVKWATCNIGAETPEEYGDYFAWGETRTKTEYTSGNSTTYNQDIGDFSGNALYDAATANWGGDWRMPTDSEMQELLNNCDWFWTQQGDVNGYKITGPNGNSIFLPATGRHGVSAEDVGEYGYYWTSTPSDEYNFDACSLLLNRDRASRSIPYRNKGMAIRPVLK